MNKIPEKEGWFWTKGRFGWTCVKVRQLDGVWVGLDPYAGKEYPLQFPNDEHWDGVEWHGEALPPDSQNDKVSDGGPLTPNSKQARTRRSLPPCAMPPAAEIEALTTRLAADLRRATAAPPLAAPGTGN